MKHWPIALCACASACAAPARAPLQRPQPGPRARPPIAAERAVGTIRVRILDADGGAPIPSRLTILDTGGARVTPVDAAGEAIAVRPGIVYSLGEVTLTMEPGRYTLYATRGTEWGRAEASVNVTRDEPSATTLSLRREVDTTGYIAADTHLHTLTHSGHGDASVAERVVTIAGEGVEFAVATDHNHNTDYGPDQLRLGLVQFYRAVTGNEITTAIGHFNGFPLAPGDPPPEHRLYRFAAIVQGIRDSGARVVTLNHPRFPNHDHSPFGTHALDPVTGDAGPAFELTVDAIELANTNTVPDDPMVLVADWLALLNRGHRIAAVGVSDSHTVGHPAGEARTYLRSTTDDPAAIDDDELYTSLRTGRASVSVGIFVDAALTTGARTGEIAPAGRGVKLGLRVASPTWIVPRTAHVFVNGQQVARRDVPTAPGEATDVRLEFDIAAPPHDAHVVCVVLGDPVVHPAWTTRRPFTMGATNPIYLDANGDGRYDSPRQTAGAMLRRYGNDLARVTRALPKIDPVIATQMLSIIRERLDEQIRGQRRRMKLAPAAPARPTPAP